MKTAERTKTPDRGKAHVAQTSQAPTPDCMIAGQWGHPPSHVLLVRERKITSNPCSRTKERTVECDHSPRQRAHKKKKVPTSEHSGSYNGTWEGPSAAEESKEEVTPSPNMRKIFTRLHERRLLTPRGGASAINGQSNQPKEGKAAKKYRTT